ncbi:hypothetical protein XENTR_v10014206 [Xenopus tropicalis]|uniref:Protein ripply2.1 n=1 Tax=Xenopus tropicalis TaxID=8364 RepID=A0A6I8SCR9_XENTR|nr:protein ripply2.1 [Xenopus tropicalis]KAE8603044.1 hypothetical protein XENTR_v10014206 [Xenopus tropicalis]|eukprot:XP_002938499.1 PREDICTED: protein ripply2 [Xenopus tropicalis]
MESNQQRGLGSCGSGTGAPGEGQCSNVALWRPWHQAPRTDATPHSESTVLQQFYSDNRSYMNEKGKPSAFQHPVKLFWPKSRCYDFMYQEAEQLLRHFPVQATISLYQETDSDSDSEGEEMYDN